MAWKSIAGTIQKDTSTGRLRIIVEGDVTEVGGGSFGDLTGSPRDNEALDEEFTNIYSKVGDLDELNTSNKSNIVAAINEIETDLANIAQDQTTLRIFKVSNYGTL
jgi:hypothetical protein